MTADDLPAHVAHWLLDRLAEQPGPLAIALSGGSTPKKLYELLATDTFAARMPWDRVHWFWGDERFVPPDDPSSNFRMTKLAMLNHVPVAADHIHEIPTVGLTPEQSAAAYEQTLRAFHGSGDLAAPLFHVVLLGLGTNGHFASLFPDTPSLAERTAWAVPVTPAGEKTRITLTYPVLESCRHAAFIVAGADKADVLARVRAGQPDLPASHYHPQGTLHWLTDDAAEGR
jgi:6-phosphogluconolactonase